MHQGHPIDLFLKKYMFFRSIFAGREFGRSDLFKDGKCCLEKYNRGCLLGFDV